MDRGTVSDFAKPSLTRPCLSVTMACAIVFVTATTASDAQEISRPPIRAVTRDVAPIATDLLGIGDGRTSGLACDADGGVYVFSSTNGTVSRLGRGGNVLWSSGRPGGGPGEYDGISAVGTAGDSTWVVDPFLRRVTFLDRHSGRVLAARLVASSSNLTGDARRRQVSTVPIALVRGGDVFGRSGASLTSPPTKLPPGTSTREYFRTPMNGGPAKQVARTEIAVHPSLESPGGGFMSLRQPFSDDPLVALAPRGEKVWVITRRVLPRERTALFAVVALSLDGDTLFSARLHTDRLAIPAAVHDSAVYAHSNIVRATGVTFDAIRASLFLPAYRPPVEAAFPTVDGKLWMQIAGNSSESRWWLIGSTDILEVEISLPRSVLTGCGHDGGLWVVRTTSDGSDVLEHYRISAIPRREQPSR